MTSSSGSAKVGITAVMALAALPWVAGAETVKTINGVDLDSSVVDFYIESRTQRPAADVDPQDRATLVNEITDIYLISTQARANELAQSERVKAQAELQYRGLLAQAVAADFVENNQATDEEIATEYAGYVTQFEQNPPKEYKARHILVEAEADAIALITQLGEGADFAELASTHSIDSSANSGGDLGWFAAETMVQPFGEAVISMEDGEYSEQPVETQFGWHVILREGIRDTSPPTLESLRDAIKQGVEQQKLQRYIEGLRPAADNDE